MNHVSKSALVAGAIELKGDDEDPVSIVTKAVDDLTKTVDERLKAVETKSVDFSPIEKRLTDLETKAARPAGGIDTKAALTTEKKAIGTFLRNGDEVELKALSTDNSAGAGWLVLPQIDTTIRTLVADQSPMRGLAEIQTVSGQEYSRFYSVGGNGAQWVGERDERPQDTDTPQLIKSTYSTSELYAAPVATQQQLDDVSTDIAAWLMADAASQFGIAEGIAFLNGDGVNGRPRGLLTYGTTTEADFDRAWGKFQHIATGAAAPTDDQLAKALITLMMTVRAPYRGNLRWVMNTNTATRIRQLQDANKRFLWAQVGNLLEGEQSMLLGSPVMIDSRFPDIGDGNLPVAFGDFKQGYLIVDRLGIRVNRDITTRKGSVVFDTYKRVGGGAGDFNAIKFIKTAAA
jgi:HK97 family phage major capsid protein